MVKDALEIMGFGSEENIESADVFNIGSNARKNLQYNQMISSEHETRYIKESE